MNKLYTEVVISSKWALSFGNIIEKFLPQPAITTALHSLVITSCKFTFKNTLHKLYDLHSSVSSFLKIYSLYTCKQNITFTTSPRLSVSKTRVYSITHNCFNTLLYCVTIFPKHVQHFIAINPSQFILTYDFQFYTIYWWFDLFNTIMSFPLTKKPNFTTSVMTIIE